MEIFAPLAERLGMQEIRAELDDLSFKIIEPELRRSILQRLKVLRLQDEELLEKTIKKIQELLMNNKVKAKIFALAKDTTSPHIAKDETSSKEEVTVLKLLRSSSGLLVLLDALS